MKPSFILRLLRSGILAGTLCVFCLQAASVEEGWFPFEPKLDPFKDVSAIDLRFLNEKFAGENGGIEVRNGRFVYRQNGQSVRFWAVNGPPTGLKPGELRECARLLAKYGVNLVRVHGGYFDQDGEVDLTKVQHAFEVVEAMKREGIYTLFSIYFPLWLTPKADHPWLKGYNGKQHPFAALFFNPDFQTHYRSWWTALLTTTNSVTGQTLVKEPAVAGVEMQNEDSFFFWTFSESNLPEIQLALLEQQFGGWLARKYGSIEEALTKWNGVRVKRDAPAEGRIGFRPLWNIFNEKTRRDQDTAAFLFEVQSTFYRETYAFLRRLGFQGVITASNWSTASPEVFGPLEKLSYMRGDFLDRHGYFGCNHKGPSAEWSIREGHTYSDRSALRFDAEQPGKARQFGHPAMDIHYGDKPSMISETTWNRPNRFRSEAPLYLAAYGALQGSDAIVHFAFDGMRWKVKPNFWMQPWTLMSPAMMGQFPAAALIFRRGLVQEGDLLADLRLNTADLFALKGTVLPQEAALDELRLKDVPTGSDVQPGQRLDPLLHYAGRSRVTFSAEPASLQVIDLKPLINHAAQTVSSSTGQLHLDYGQGVLTLKAPEAQGASGSLGAVASFDAPDLTIKSDMELGHIVAVSLDARPLASSDRILLQVMSEEKPNGFQTEPVSPSVRRIVSIGHDPWLVKEIRGQVRLKRADASALKATALDENGYPLGPAGTSDQIDLQPRTLYYLISR